MRRVWTRVNRLDPVRASTVAVALPVIAAIAAYGVVAFNATPTAGAIAAAAAMLAVGGSGLLYAWRLGPGGLSD